MKQMSIYSISSTLTELRAYPNNIWSSLKVKMVSTMGTLVSALGILSLPTGLHWKWFQNKMSCVHKHTRPNTLPKNNIHIEVQPIKNPVPEISDQLSPQLDQ